MKSLIIRNGIIVDSETASFYNADIAVEGNKIVAIEEHITEPAVSEVDATGCYVTPGLIDHHTHIYPLAKIGTPGAAACFAAGVTTAVDAGSTGCDNFGNYQEFIKNEKLRIKAYIHVCSTGLASLPTLEDVDPAHMDLGKIKEAFAKYGENLLGLKLRTSQPIVKDFGWKPIKRAVEIGEELGVPVMVHITDPPSRVSELLEILRPDDIVTHMYQNKGFTLLENGKVSEAAYKAREKGILFEASDAREHFSFEVSEPAIREGFYPDILGTDITKLSMHLRPTAFNMAMQISKYAYLGIPFEQVIQRATYNTAITMGLQEEIGSLKVGKLADIAVFRPAHVKNVFGDRPYANAEVSLRDGNLVYEPVLTVKDGEMVYRNITF